MKKSRLRNASFKSSVKTAIRAVHEAVAVSDKGKAVVALSNAHKKLDKGLAKGIYHKKLCSKTQIKFISCS